jgi:Transposase DDE domain
MHTLLDLLRHGSRLRRFRAPLRLASGWRLLRHPRQIKPGCPPRLLRTDRSGDRHHCRPLDGNATRKDDPDHLRRVRFKDPESGKTLVFLTNQSALPATSICALDKSRWQVELFFKWIKQHLRIKKFYGASDNAVKAQIWIAVSVYVLVAIVKKRLALEASLYTLLPIFSVTLFEKMPMPQELSEMMVQAEFVRLLTGQ